MILEQVPAVQKLSADEKWQLIEELWQELLPPPGRGPQPEIVRLLESRLAEYRDNPATAAPWVEVKARLRAARGE
jgi:putative addiction module component (TIGR02574 family)